MGLPCLSLIVYKFTLNLLLASKAQVILLAHFFNVIKGGFYRYIIAVVGEHPVYVGNHLPEKGQVSALTPLFYLLLNFFQYVQTVVDVN